MLILWFHFVLKLAYLIVCVLVSITEMLTAKVPLIAAIIAGTTPSLSGTFTNISPPFCIQKVSNSINKTYGNT